jgi:Ca-activated chloride channel family protein
MGNYNDPLMEELAKKGNGNYAYVDTLNEARRIFVENLTGTLQTIAKDAKVQVKFNLNTVRQFRLIGYESRQMKHEDFRNDEADAGEIGSGHSVTALYEVKIERGVDSGKLAKVSIRYEDPDTQEVTEVSEKFAVEDLKAKFEDASQGLQFAATVAQFAEILRESFWVKNGCLKTVRQTLKGILQQQPKIVAKDEAQAEKRGEELLALVRNARRIKEQEQASK